MAYDVELADRVRDLLAAEPELIEKRMFGGLAFLVAGHMAVAATSGGLMLRVDPDQSETLLRDPQATRMMMQGRELAGWLLIDLNTAATNDDLRASSTPTPCPRSDPGAPNSGWAGLGPAPGNGKGRRAGERERIQEGPVVRTRDACRPPA